MWLNNHLSRLLDIWASWTLKRPLLVLAAALAIAVGSIYLAAERLELVTDQLELISPTHPLLRLSDKLDKFRMGGKSSFTVVVEAPRPQMAVDFIEHLASGINKDKEHFEDFIIRIDPDRFKKWQLLYLSKQELLDVVRKLEENDNFVRGFSENPDLIGFLKLANQELTSKMVSEIFTGFLDEQKSEDRGDSKTPFDLRFLIATFQGLLDYLQGVPAFDSPWTSFFKSSGLDPKLEGYFWEGDKRFLMAFLIPKKSENGFLTARESLVKLRELIGEAKNLFPEVQAGITGQEALRYDEVNIVSDDMTKATWVSLLGVFLLMVVFFRGLQMPLIQIATLIFGLCWAFGCITLLIGHLNILSVVFAPLLCGLGVDYGIHWISRYEEEEGYANGDPQSIIRRVTEKSGRAIFYAGLSGALCFLPLAFTGFRGIMEMGYVTGIGILCVVAATFSVLPALTVLVRNRPRRKSPATARGEIKLLFRISPFGGRIILAFLVLISLSGAWEATRVFFDPNPLRLQSAGAESVIWQKKLIDNAKRTPLFANAFCDSPEEAKGKMVEFERLPSVFEVQSIFSLLPEDQEEKLPIVHALGKRLPAIRNVDLDKRPINSEELVDIIEKMKFKMRDDKAEEWGSGNPLAEQMRRFRSLAQDLIKVLSEARDTDGALLRYNRRFAEDSRSKWDLIRGGANATPIEIMDLPEIIRDRFVQDGTYLLRIYPRGSIFEEHVLDNFVREIQCVDPDVIGAPVSFYVFSNAMRIACIKGSVYSLLTIFILLMLTFRDLKTSLLALIPLIAGTLWTVGIMGVANIQFNLANCMFMPLILGAGVEYAIIILQRWKEGDTIPGHLPFSTGKGVIVAALSTTIGFGALMISQHRGIFSLGFVAWEGSLCVLVSAVVILPAILSLLPSDARTRFTAPSTDRNR